MQENPQPFKGEAGAPGVVDYETVRKEVLASIPPTSLALTDRNGNETEVQQVKPGGKFIIPPVRLNIYDDVNDDGQYDESEVFRLAKPLGAPIELEVTGALNAN